MSLAIGRVLATMSLVLVCLGSASAQPGPGHEPFEFALIGDPQIGYGPGAEYADAGRFAQIVDHVNAQGLPLAIIAGDLVQDRSLWQQWIFAWIARRLQPRVLLAAGNHDVVDAGSLEAFRNRHGKDYYDAVLHNVAFVVINSETARDERISVSEFAAQWDFIASSLDAHREAGRRHTVLVMHRPPFVDNESEPESEQNWPPATRARLLALARAHGVRWILAGHLHRTHVAEASDGLRIVVGAGSARSFDRSPIAYHRFRVANEGLTHQHIVVAPPPAEAFSVPGLRGWTPRLFDPSLRHWTFTLMYGAAGASALLSAHRLAQRPGGDPRPVHLWRGVAMALFAFGANMQLDIDELLSELLRIATRVAGLHEIRHTLSAVILLTAGGAAALWLARAQSGARIARPAAIALSLLAVPSAWFALSVVSHHRLGMLFNEGWWDLLVLTALGGIMLCAARVRRPRSA